MPGQINWNSRGADTNEYIVNPVIQKNMAHQYRYRSNFGKLSGKMQGITFQDGNKQVGIDLGANAIIGYKDIGFGSGDEVRFNLLQNIKGEGTYGDAPVKTGDYLKYLHQNIRINKFDTPAIPLQEEMSRIKVDKILGDESSTVRGEISRYLSEEYSFEVIRSFLRGASQGILASTDIGGLGEDLGRGAGKQISNEHFLIPGVGEIAPPTASTLAALDTYEQAIADALVAADADIAGLSIDAAREKYGMKRTFIHDLREYISDTKIGGVEMRGQEKWFVAVDPAFFKDLTRPGSELYQAWLTVGARTKANEVYGYTGQLELDEFIFFREPYLKNFRPVNYASGEVTYGSNALDLRDRIPTSQWCMMMIMGKMSMIEAASGAVSITEDAGKHGKGREIAAHIKQTFKRMAYKPKDGRTTAALNQASAAMAFWTPDTILI